MIRVVVIAISNIDKGSLESVMKAYSPSQYSYSAYSIKTKELICEIALCSGFGPVTFLDHCNLGRGSSEYWQIVSDLTEQKINELAPVLPVAMEGCNVLSLLKRGVATSSFRAEVENVIEFYQHVKSAGFERTDVVLACSYLTERDVGRLEAVLFSDVRSQFSLTRSVFTVHVFGHPLGNTFKKSVKFISGLELRSSFKKWRRRRAARENATTRDRSLVVMNNDASSFTNVWDGVEEIHSDLGVLFPEQRAKHVLIKAQHFKSVIGAALGRSKRVVLVVPNVVRYEQTIESLNQAFTEFANNPNFRILLVPKRAGSAGLNRKLLRAALTIFRASFFRKNLTANFQALLLSIYQRLFYFEQIYKSIHVSSWLGLTGYLKLPLFHRLSLRKDGGNVLIGALQFGVAAKEQKAYRFYSVARLFAYDERAVKDFQEAGMQADRFIVSGSLEIENLLDFSHTKCLESGDRLVVAFFDQPVLQRGEFDANFRSESFELLYEIARMDTIVYIKLHPRTSKDDFPHKMHAQKNIIFVESEPDLNTLLFSSHVVVSYFSNLLDVALDAGNKVISLGGGRVYSKDKVAEIRSRSGLVIEDFTEAVEVVASMCNDRHSRDRQFEKARNVRLGSLVSKAPSEVILDELFPSTPS